ncbi:hypothetical protein FCULG_00003693 [Fusarium culmorum]|uniref:Pru domain-containing protein n=1 Tax=Fusarium culmorum TaxID=5516 RepID=A0A2T4H7Y5_FUSCU|nr:hypothetical protein FCULG_00003693 [Fusarium culmorum]
MPISPILTFKAGQCEVDTSSKPYKVKPQSEPGYIYLYSEDDLVHFCWRKRTEPLDNPELDLIMVPTDGSFTPYESTTSSEPTSKTDVKAQSENGDAAYYSPRDRKIGDIVNRLLQGEEVEVAEEMATVRNDDQDDDEDEAMEDADNQRPESNEAAEVRDLMLQEEMSARRARARERVELMVLERRVSSSAPGTDASAAVRSFLDSLRGQSGISGGQQQQQRADKAPEEFADTLISFLPPAVIVLASGSASAVDGKSDPPAATVEAAKASLSLDDKRTLLKKVLRSPQFNQALASLTMAIRDGGLPSIADALGVKVQDGGYLRGSGMPLGGGQAVEAFVNGVKKTVEEEKK